MDRLNVVVVMCYSFFHRLEWCETYLQLFLLYALARRESFERWVGTRFRASCVWGMGVEERMNRNK